MAFAPPRLKATPITQPARYGLLSVAEIILDNELAASGVEWRQNVCRRAEIAGIDCPPLDNQSARPEKVGVPKQFIQHDDWIELEPFLVYGSSGECSPGQPYDDFRNRALDHLQGGEGRAVELAFMAGGFHNTLTLANSGTVDLTPAAGAVNIDVGIAVLEGWAGDNIPSVPVLHMPRTIASLACGDQIIHRTANGARLETCLGAAVAAGAGYSANYGPGGATADAGEAWVYITGPVRIYRGDIIVVPESFGDGALRLTDNTVEVLAERPYAVGYECGAAAIRVKVC